MKINKPTNETGLSSLVLGSKSNSNLWQVRGKNETVMRSLETLETERVSCIIWSTGASSSAASLNFKQSFDN